MRRRYQPSAARKTALLEEFGDKCAYCRLPFGTVVWKRVGLYSNYVLHVQWDHAVPRAFTESDADDQFLPACQLCNLLKSDIIFKDLSGACEYLEPIWVSKYEMSGGPVNSWEHARLLAYIQ